MGKMVRFAGAGILAAALGVSYAAPQARDLRAFHRSGQTFLVWKEARAADIPKGVSVVELKKLRTTLARERKIRYRIYRSEKPITGLDDLKPIAEAPPLSAWNLDYYGIYPKPDQRAFRYVIEPGGEPLAEGEGLYVYNPKKAQRAYYAVTYVEGEKENRSLEGTNVLKRPVEETVGQGVPVLQRIVKPKSFQYVRNPTLRYYVRWEAPPNSSVAGKPFDYLVAFPPKRVRPAPVGIHLHCWGGSLNGGYGWWYNAEKGAILLASNQIPYDWWTGYHEFYWSGPPDREKWKKGVVRAYTQKRLLSFLDWMAGQWDIDLARTFVAGSSMGGSGAPMFAIRHSERIAWAVSWVGVHVPARSPQFRSSYRRVYGDPSWGIKFEDGTAVWDYFDDVWYLIHHPEKEIGFITFSNGKNDRGIGWEQARDFLEALQKTHRPHLFVWGQAGHGQRARMPVSLAERVLPIDVRVDQSLPAFSRCSLDDDPGDGEPAGGAAEGQVNLYLFWETKDLIDSRDRWEATLGLVEKAPSERCEVDVTPRRVRLFKPRNGERVSWTAADLESGTILKKGTARADRFGLVTAKGVPVTKRKVRLLLRRN